MQPERLHEIVGQLQVELGAVVPGNGSLTLHFQGGRVQAVEMTLHTRVAAPKPATPTLPR